jgi:TonB family protein
MVTSRAHAAGFPEQTGTLAQTNTGFDGSKVYKIGGSVSAPRATQSPPPEYSNEARDAKYQGTCVLGLIVGTDGLPRDVKGIRRLGLGLDEKAVEAVKQWKFKPAMKDADPLLSRSVSKSSSDFTIRPLQNRRCGLRRVRTG